LGYSKDSSPRIFFCPGLFLFYESRLLKTKHLAFLWGEAHFQF
jgi:hypothetical protein